MMTREHAKVPRAPVASISDSRLAGNAGRRKERLYRGDIDYTEDGQIHPSSFQKDYRGILTCDWSNCPLSRLSFEHAFRDHERFSFLDDDLSQVSQPRINLMDSVISTA